MTSRLKNKIKKIKTFLFMYYSLWCVLGCYIDGILVAKLASLFIYLRKERVKRIDAFVQKKKTKNIKAQYVCPEYTIYAFSFFVCFFKGNPALIPPSRQKCKPRFKSCAKPQRSPALFTPSGHRICPTSV